VLDSVLPGDLNSGDVITLPDSQQDLVVRAFRLGQGGFLLTVAPLSNCQDLWIKIVLGGLRLVLLGWPLDQLAVDERCPGADERDEVGWVDC
jgi:hypothetical protein